MKTTIHSAQSRGHADYGWLKTHYTFSFSNYYHPERIQFGALRVLNDDLIAAGKGFGTHPHHNMEIISIPLSGHIEHQDNMGNTSTIRAGEVQAMSAGSGISHSEFNRSLDTTLELLQIWVLPRVKDVEPRYQQISIADISRTNQFYQILSPSAEDQGVWIHQDAWFSLGNFETEKSDTYTLHLASNGVYLFVIEGSIIVEGHSLSARDGMAISETDSFTILATDHAQVLVMEVPLT